MIKESNFRGKEVRARPYWMISTSPSNSASHLFLLSEKVMDFFQEPERDGRTLTEREKAILKSAIQFFKTAQVRNKKEVRTSRELVELKEPSLVEGIEAYKQLKRVLGGASDQIVNETLSVCLKVLEAIYLNKPFQDIPPEKLQKVKDFFVSASNYAFDAMAARYRT